MSTGTVRRTMSSDTFDFRIVRIVPTGWHLCINFQHSLYFKNWVVIVWIGWTLTRIWSIVNLRVKQYVTRTSLKRHGKAFVCTIKVSFFEFPSWAFPLAKSHDNLNFLFVKNQIFYWRKINSWNNYYNKTTFFWHMLLFNCLNNF